MIKKYLFEKLKELAHSDERNFWMPIYKVIKRKGGNAIISVNKLIEENEIKLWTKNMVVYGGVAYKNGFIADNKILITKDMQGYKVLDGSWKVNGIKIG